MAIATGEQLRFHSRPYLRRPGFLPSVVALVIGGTLVAFTVFMTWTVIYEGNPTRELLIDDDVTTLSSRDENRRSRITRSLALTDIVPAEHCKSSDTNSTSKSAKSVS